MHRESRYPGDVQGALRDRQIVCALQVDPEIGTVAEQLAETNRHLCGDGLLLVEDIVRRRPSTGRHSRAYPSACAAFRRMLRMAGSPSER